MMSPLSVAQYLDPTNEELQFDVVIFDEASQVKPEDALGAFMRGKTAVVMGDTQQLPPTSFFDQMATGESEEEVATSLDMESILHLCKPVSYTHLESVCVLLQKSPKNIDVSEVKSQIESLNHVDNISDMHLWSLDGIDSILTLKISIDDVNNGDEVKNEIQTLSLIHI